MKQNKILLEHLSLNTNNLNLSANNIGIRSKQSINNRNGYFVMPDFNNSLTEFSCREPGEEAQFWLNCVESVAKLHE